MKQGTAFVFFPDGNLRLGSRYASLDFVLFFKQHVCLSLCCLADWRVCRVGVPHPDVPAPSQGVNTRMLLSHGILTGSDY